MIVATGFGMPAWASAFFADLPGRARLALLRARVDGEAQACAAMLVHAGLAEFGLAATLEPARGRGCQLALLHRRILDADRRRLPDPLRRDRRARPRPPRCQLPQHPQSRVRGGLPAAELAAEWVNRGALPTELLLNGVFWLWLPALVPAAVVTVLKGRLLLFFAGWLTLGVTWLVGALPLADPGSAWAKRFYGEDRLARAIDPVEVERDLDRGMSHEGGQGLGVDSGRDHERGVGMAGLVQPQPTQCPSLPCSIRSPIDRRGLKRLADLVAKNKSLGRRFTSCDPILHQVVAEKTWERRRPLGVLGLRRDRPLLRVP